MTVYYEWDVEEVCDVDHLEQVAKGDVIEHFFQESFADCKAHVAKYPADIHFRYDIGLVCDDNDGRSWAYLTDDGKLPEYFEDANGANTRRVPQRFHTEVEKFKLTMPVVAA